eukprot:213151-Chlamydomonas_euryale.AAC.1
MAQGGAAGSILGVRTPPAGARAAQLSNDDSVMVGGRQDIGPGGRVRGAAFVGCEGGVAVRSQGVVASGARRLDAALERRVEVGRHKVVATDTCLMC